MEELNTTKSDLKMPQNPPHFSFPETQRAMQALLFPKNSHSHSVSVSDFSPVGILHLHARSQNGAMPHWHWVSNYTPLS
jgi:hypothetical protein